MFQLKILKRTNLLFILTIFILCSIGAINVLATTYFPEKQPSQLFFNQIIFYIVGFGIFLVLSALDIKSIQKNLPQLLIYLSTLILLITVIVAGEEIYGAKRWIRVGTFTLQPSEFSKIAITVLSAFFLNKYRESQRARQPQPIADQPQAGESQRIRNVEYLKSLRVDFAEIKNYIFNFKKVRIKNKFNILLPFPTLFSAQILLAITLIGLIFLQNSLGNTVLNLLILVFVNLFFFDFTKELLLYFLLVPIGIMGSIFFQIQIWIGLVIVLLLSLLILKLYFKFNILIALTIILSSSLLIPTAQYIYNNVLKDYQRERIDTYLNPNEYDYTGARWNVEQSKNAIASAGFTGKGFLKGTQSNYQILPFSFTDFAYASFTEQFGTIGDAVLILLYAILILQILSTADVTKNTFKQLIAYGVAIMLFLNIMQHVAMNLGFVPVTGVPLPLISYGGSSVLVTFIGLGLVSAVKNSVEGKGVKVIKN
jgi:rod shape determining protein RodA